MRWRDKAACKNSPSEIFYPLAFDEKGGVWLDDGTIWEAFGDTSHLYDSARAICSHCPVKDICLESALVNKERWGMWGGLSPIERRRIERKDRRNRLKDKRSKEAQLP